MRLSSLAPKSRIRHARCLFHRCASYALPWHADALWLRESGAAISGNHWAQHADINDTSNTGEKEINPTVWRRILQNSFFFFFTVGLPTELGCQGVKMKCFAGHTHGIFRLGFSYWIDQVCSFRKMSWRSIAAVTFLAQLTEHLGWSEA